jgi:hypothetical protein
VSPETGTFSLPSQLSSLSSRDIVAYLFYRFEFDDLLDGAKDFFAGDAHVVGDVGEDGGLDEVALVAHLLSARHQFRSFLLPRLDQF